jgi:predicted porin
MARITALELLRATLLYQYKNSFRSEVYYNGKKSLEIAGPNVDKNIGMLHREYAFEMQTSHYFQYVANNIEGLRVLFEDFF